MPDPPASTPKQRKRAADSVPSRNKSRPSRKRQRAPDPTAPNTKHSEQHAALETTPERGPKLTPKPDPDGIPDKTREPLTDPRPTEQSSAPVSTRTRHAATTPTPHPRIHLPAVERMIREQDWLILNLERNMSAQEIQRRNSTLRTLRHARRTARQNLDDFMSDHPPDRECSSYSNTALDAHGWMSLHQLRREVRLANLAIRALLTATPALQSKPAE